ncbi:hypothetical protein [Maritalea porphyrae]|uniref:Uncharacterized protein n=1 Tax=Maritalea porphyrae TaxID=880732 RepID=A0ABQ5UQ94_9HYPH|nr:hypothetical protein [Maritalea porphyrae]GLQ16604.1 hypothetical protein GCM10007879_08530 [Maritalea porphyrae]
MSTDQNGTSRPNSAQNLPLVLEPAPRRRSLNGNYRPDASFLAQVIAGKTGAPIYRAKRRASVGEAQTAYAQNNERKIVRMPKGYLRALEA